MIRHLRIDVSKGDYFTRLQESVKDALNVQDLTKLHKLWKYDRFSRAQDQYSMWHQRFYEAINETYDDGWTISSSSRPVYANSFRRHYLSFIENVVFPMFGESIVYQTIPTFRVHLPDNVAVGEKHKDCDYGHSTHEVNFWLPLTDAYNTASVFVGNKPLNASAGQMWVFDGANLEHSNVENIEGYTRVSIDFRVVPQSLYLDNPNYSINSGKKFMVGDYFSEMPKAKGFY